jgi:hypothetical protein
LLIERFLDRLSEYKGKMVDLLGADIHCSHGDGFNRLERDIGVG